MITFKKIYPVRVVWLALALSGSATLTAQIPDTFTNLRHFPEDITRDSLIGIMRGFTFALGVRCQYCHAGGDGRSFEGVEFDSDEKAAKRKARFMLGMVRHINNEFLAELPDRTEPSVVLECQTCHRGLTRPRMIDDILRERIATDGVDSAVAEYRRLREQTYGTWSYDFGEWAVNGLATEMAVSGNAEAAVALMKMNAEYYPESVSVWRLLGDLQRRQDDRDGAISSYQKALELAPGRPDILQRLRALGVNPPS